MPANELIPISSALTRQQYAELRALSAKTFVPMTVYVRQAVAALLKQAKKGRVS